MTAHAVRHPTRQLRAHCGSWSAESSEPNRTRSATPRRVRRSDQTVTHHLGARTRLSTVPSGDDHSPTHNRHYGATRPCGRPSRDAAGHMRPSTTAHVDAPARVHFSSVCTRHAMPTTRTTAAPCNALGLHEDGFQSVKPRAFQRTVHRQWHCLTCHLMQCRSTCQGKHHDSGQRRRRLYSHGTYLTVCLVQCIAYRRTPYGDASARERCYNNRDRHRDRGCAPYMGGYVRCTSVMRLVMCTDEW